VSRRAGDTRTKIVATLGPASASPREVLRLARAGADVFRVNFSHGDPGAHARTIAAVRAAEREVERPLAILGDLQGPRLRLGRVDDPRGVLVRRGDRVDLIVGATSLPAGARGRGRAIALPVAYAGLARDVRAGQSILIADGQVELVALRVARGRVETIARSGGMLTSHKGINLPESRVSLPALTRKDRADLAFAARHGVDLLGLSFVRRPGDVDEARRLLRRAGSDAWIVPKIERREAVDDLEAILERADAVMIARGDLATEVGLENVPILQKRIVRAARALGRPSITATQMLESMIENPRPTRAEASDVANAVLDGTDAVMLSGETAVGRDPENVVRTMARIVARAERASLEGGAPRAGGVEPGAPRGALARAAVATAGEIGAAGLVAFTKSGRTALDLARERPGRPIVAVTESRAVARRLALAFGVRARVVPRARTVAGLLDRGERVLRAGGDARRGDLVVVLVGTSLALGGTNTLLVHAIGGARGSLPKGRRGP